MTPTALEIRIILYGILTLGVIAGSAWSAAILTSHHYERIISADKIAQDQALQAAQQHVIAAQAAQAAAQIQAEKDHEMLVQADTVSRDAVLSSVRGLESALHLSRLPAPVDHPGGTLRPPAVAGSDPELESAVAGVNRAVEQAVAACQHDSGNYAYILSIAPKVTP